LYEIGWFGHVDHLSDKMMLIESNTTSMEVEARESDMGWDG